MSGATPGESPSPVLRVVVESFSYKSVKPEDPTSNGGGFVFDCRGLPNPGREERFARRTGLDGEVAAYLEKDSVVGTFLGHVRGCVGLTVGRYLARGFTDLHVAFGCTGGQHRSVYCAESIARWLASDHPVTVDVRHGELVRKGLLRPEETP